MAKRKGKNSGGRQGRGSEEKKGFWSHFFEPVPPDDELDPASANRQYGEPPGVPLTHLFTDDELDYSDEKDAANLAHLTWSDGERVVPDSVRLRLHADGDARSAGAKKKKGKAASGSPIRLFDDEAAAATGRTGRKDTTRTRIFRTGASTTARININETEETIRMEEAQRKARAREAARKHEEFLERQDRRAKRAALLKQIFGNLAFVLVLLAGILVALYYGFLLSDIVVMDSQDEIAADYADYIVQRSGLKLGTHMLFCDLDGAELGIEEDPYLQVDSITYIFPSRIRIIVTERKEVAGIVGLDYNVIIDKNGYVLSMSGGTDLSGLVQVTGVSMAGFQLGQRLGQGNDFATATLVQLIAVLEQYSLVGSIQSIDLTTPLAITMVATNGLKVHVGQATDLDAKMYTLSRLLPSFTANSVSVGTLYLSAKGGTVYSPSSDYARPVVTIPDDGAEPDSDFVDNNNDGLDDNTNEPYVSPPPTSAPVTTPSPGGDDFSG